MRKRSISQTELDEVIRLRQAGSSFLKIQKETGIPRRTAKRTYTDWEKNQATEELKRARQDVVKEILREHMNSLLGLAEYLLDRLSAPVEYDEITDAKEFFDDMIQNIPYPNSTGSKQSRTRTENSTIKIEFYKPRFTTRRNQMLFDSLREHTREDKRWQTLERWKDARSKCARLLKILRKEVSDTIGNILNQESRKDLANKIELSCKGGKATNRMENLVVKAVWQGISTGGEDPTFPKLEIESHGGDIIYVKSGEEMVLEFNNKEAANLVVDACNRTVTNLGAGDSVGHLQEEILAMQAAVDQLWEMLEPLKLRNTILRTRCDICPA